MNKTIKISIISILLFSLLSTSFIIPLSSTSISDDELDQQQTQVNSVEFIYNESMIAQSFRPTLPELTRIQLYISKQGEISSNFTVEIKESLMEEPIAEVSIPSENVPTIEPQWLTFDFSNFEITQEETYYIIGKTGSGDLENYYKWYTSSIDAYENGLTYITNNSGRTWEQISSMDCTFKTYGAGPILDIVYINGGPGNKISIGIENIGTSQATNVKVTGSFTEGLMFKKWFEYTLNHSIEADELAAIELSPVIGLGPATFNINVWSEKAATVEKTTYIFMLIFYVYIPPSYRLS